MGDYNNEDKKSFFDKLSTLQKRIIIGVAAVILIILFIILYRISGDYGKPTGGLTAVTTTTSSQDSDIPEATDNTQLTEPDGETETTPVTDDNETTTAPNGDDISEPTTVPSDDSTATTVPGGDVTTTTPVEGTTTTTTSKLQDDEPAAVDGYLLEYSTDNSWASGNQTMYGVQFGITNMSDSAVNGWKLEMVIEGIGSCEGWNGTYSVSTNKLTVTNVDYNGGIGIGGTVVVGCNLGTTKAFKVTSATLNGVACTVRQGTVSQNNPNNNNNNQNNNNNNNNNQGGNQQPSVDVDKLLERSENAVQGDDWLYAQGNKIVDKSGKEVWLTGVNWFGYNTGTNIFDGLWNSQLEPSVKAIADRGFNLIRVPISAELINQWAAGEYPRANYNQAYNAKLNGMNSLEIFDYFLKLAEANGIKVMPDIHSAETDASGHITNLWYTSEVSVEEFYSALEWMADRYKNNDTIIAYDLKNEPHGKPYEGDNAAIWNNSKDANNWKYVAETAAARILAKNPNVLILVEGIEIYPKDIKTNGDFSSTNEKDYYFNWWGGNLRGVSDYPINLGKHQNKLVYSPHDYGPTVYAQSWFSGDYTYDSLMEDCWYDNWFYIYDDGTAPLLIGEWGGFMREPNLKWMTYMRQLIKTYKLHHTFWCFNANSGDTGGLVLDDFVTWDEEKYAFVKEVLWQQNGKFVGLDHAIPLGDNGITLTQAKSA